ncbi:MAG: ubiquitin-like small modifier protein 1 [Promethearchaeota archaeon]
MTKPKGTITVRFFTSIRALTGSKEIQIEATSIQELIDLLTARYGEKFRQMLLEKDGSLKNYFHILVNGRHVRLLKGLQTPLAENDIVAIFPPIGGG